MGLSRRRREEGFGPQPVDRLGRSLQNLTASSAPAPSCRWSSMIAERVEALTPRP